MKKIVLFTFFLIFTLTMKGQITNPEVIKIKNELITHAIEVGKQHGINLDLSDESIKNVEIILSEMHKDYVKTENDEGLNGLAYMFGFYIIDVIEKNHGIGRIERDHPEFGKNFFSFYWDGGTLFPLAWCQKRIFDGEADNVETKYRILVLEKERK